MILDAFLSVPRENFVPKDLSNFSYLEKHLDLRNQRFLLKSSLIAKIISSADIRPDDAVLVIGSSTGYSSAILSKVAETVISIEEDQDLVNFSEKSIKKNEIDNVVFIKKNLSDGCPEHGLFSRIIIEGAIESRPKKYFRPIR
jgi:protein-L-isoaspartate(D-aspartate) O-methyltransferase